MIAPIQRRDHSPTHLSMNTSVFHIKRERVRGESLRAPTRVCHVERDVGRGELPFYTVAFADGRERQTVAARLRPCLPAKEEEEEA